MMIGQPYSGKLKVRLDERRVDAAESDRRLPPTLHCNIYVRTQRAGQRVMASVTRFIERRLRLKVNAAKSAVARPEERHFLGFSLRKRASGVGVFLSVRTKERAFARLSELTPRTWGNSLRECIRRLNAYLRGWLGFFGICTAGNEPTLKWLDMHIRQRLRAIQLKHWKCKWTIARSLQSLGVSEKLAWGETYAKRKSIWALVHSRAVLTGLRNSYFAERGLLSLAEMWQQHQAATIVAPVQLEMALGRARS
jgi:RNA-directed DNA polymerase